MPTIARPAVEIQQGHLTLYLTYVTPADFEIPNFYDVDHLEPKGTGYQRILNNTRANRLTRYLTEAFPKGYANLPTTIFLATDREIDFDADKNEMCFETDEVCPFSVVDGQHRISGLLKSVSSEHALRDFKLPATIAVSLDDTHQMYHFYIVNTQQQPVEAALQQQITRRFTDMNGVEDLPYLPHWLAAMVSRGTDAHSLRLVEFLNENPDSPLQGRVQMANDFAGNKGRIKQAGLVNMFKSNVFTSINPIFMREPDHEKRNQIMLHYFRAVDRLFVPHGKSESSRVYQNNGLFFFLVISKWVFTSMYADGLNFTEDAIAQTIEGALAELDPPYQDIAEPNWWLPGSVSGSLNRASATLYASEFSQALVRSQSHGS